MSLSSSKVGPFLVVALSVATVIVLPSSSVELTASQGMRVLLVPRKPILTPMYSGWSLSSTKRSSTLPIFSPTWSYTVKPAYWSSIAVNLSLRSSMYSPFRKEMQLRYLSIQFLLSNREDTVVVAKHDYLLLPSVDL